MIKAFDKITVKLVLSYFLIMFLTLMTFGYYISNSLGEYLHLNDKIDITTVSNVISNFAGDYVSEDNKSISEDFEEFLKTFNLNSDFRVMVTNKDAVVLYDSFNDSAVIGKTQVKQSVITALSGSEGFEQTESKETKITTLDVSTPIKNADAIIGAVNITYSSNKVNSFMNIVSTDIIFMSIIVCILIGLIIFIITNFISKKLVGITKQITEMSDGILDERIEVKGDDEVSQLGRAFNTMSEKLEQLEDKRLQFVSNASHELKTPLSSIKLIADSIIQTPDIQMEQVRDFLGDMNNEVDRLNRIIDKLLTLTKMDAEEDSAKTRFELCNLSDMVNDICKNLLPLASKKDVTLSSSVCDDAFMQADSDRLWQGIYNIIDNAIKYTKEYGLVNVSMTKTNTDAIITVEDNGIGMLEGELDKIFDRFYRVDKARSRETGGTGLGLSIALASINMHGGTISVTSEINMGSRFEIVLPLTQLTNS